MQTHVIHWPEDIASLQELHSGDVVRLSGTIYTARDAAHRRIVALLEEGKPLPFVLQNSAIYYAGPCPCPPGRTIGSIGPTTASRMDVYKERLMQAGMKLMIGKGICSPELADLCCRYGAVYLAAPSGVAALSSACVRQVELVAWEDLGAEAVRKLTVQDMGLVVINDVYGNDYYRQVLAEQR